MKTIVPNQRSLAVYAWLGPNKIIFSSGRHFLSLAPSSANSDVNKDLTFKAKDQDKD